MLTINYIQECVKKVAVQFPVKKVSLFGSYARGEADERSDVDFLVEFKMPMVSLLMLADLRRCLEEALQTDVDVVHAPVSEGSLLEIGKVIDVYEQYEQ